MTSDKAGEEVAEILEWLKTRRAACRMTVERIGLERVEGWKMEPETGEFHHVTGGFFRITGIRVRDAFQREVSHWCQPIIDQRGGGILGLLVREQDGQLLCLVQAKPEPGNIGTILLAPTVQSTASNLKKVHGGAKSAFAEIFEDPPAGSVLYAARQTEAGGRFLRGENLNIVVRAPDDLEARGIPDYFRWIALGDLKELVRRDYLVNPYLRSLLACLWTTFR